MFDTDKFFWHNYIPFYEKFFADRNFTKIAEIGLFKGDSVRWLLNRFPTSAIIGADILTRQDTWPVDERFLDCQLDQGDLQALENFFSLGPYNLIIEDGSHFPEHQVSTLLIGIKHLTSDGVYILEDVHTSHPKHKLNKQPTVGNALSVLLALAHYRRNGIAVTEERAELIAKNSLVTTDEVIDLDSALKEIVLYKRTILPDKCYECGSQDYEFSQYRCQCGAEIFSDTDSMSFVLIKE